MKLAIETRRDLKRGSRKVERLLTPRHPPTHGARRDRGGNNNPVGKPDQLRLEGAERMAICPTCGEEFVPRPNQRYCRRGCRPSAKFVDRWGEPVPEGTADRDEIVRLLWRAARLGSVPAMMVLVKEMKR